MNDETLTDEIYLSEATVTIGRLTEENIFETLKFLYKLGLSISPYLIGREIRGIHLDHCTCCGSNGVCQIVHKNGYYAIYKIGDIVVKFIALEASGIERSRKYLTRELRFAKNELERIRLRENNILEAL